MERTESERSTEGDHSFTLQGKLIQLISLIGPLLGLLLVFGIFVALAPDGFARQQSIETIARQTAITGMAAIGMTLIIIAGGIDLSVGSIIALVTVVIAMLINRGLDPLLASFLGIITGAACGVINGLVITRLGVVPFIATLGSLLAIRGVAKGLAGEQKIDAPLTGLNELLAVLRPEDRWMLMPTGVWLTILFAVLATVLLRLTRLGRHILAIGSNEKTARLCGIAISRVKVTVYAVGAGFAGMAGVLQYSRLTVGDPTVAMGLELDVIAAVVIGGGSLSGGEGSIFGCLIGALIMAVIRSGCSQMGLSNWVQEIITGGIIVLAVALDRWRQRSSYS